MPKLFELRHFQQLRAYNHAFRRRLKLLYVRRFRMGLPMRARLPRLVEKIDAGICLGAMKII